MIERHDYLGHQIVLNLEQFRSKVRWSWRIDGIHTAKASGVKPVEQARAEALFFAHRLLDQWNRQKANGASAFLDRRLDDVQARYGPVAAFGARLPQG